MKVAYNNCYGSFGLSPKSVHEIARRKGITLTWYKEDFTSRTFTRLPEIPLTDCYNNQPLIRDLGERFVTCQTDAIYAPEYSRTDEDLITVIETMGKSANGDSAELRIIEIPDGADFEICERSGVERILPPRPLW